MTLDIESISKIAAPIMHKALDPYGLDEVSFMTDFDHDGDPVIRASLKYKPNSGKPDAEALVHAVNEVLEKLALKGDERFLHLRHSYAVEALSENWGKQAKRKEVRQQ
jgi:hypothetical protein